MRDKFVTLLLKSVY